MKDRMYVVNLDKSKSIAAHGIVLYANRNSVTCFGGSDVEHILGEI